jgi:hypothetical protein
MPLFVHSWRMNVQWVCMCMLVCQGGSACVCACGYADVCGPGIWVCLQHMGMHFVCVYALVRVSLHLGMCLQHVGMH